MNFSSSDNRLVVVFSFRNEIVLFCKRMIGTSYHLLVYSDFSLPDLHEKITPEAVLIDPKMSGQNSLFDLYSSVQKFFSQRPMFIVPQEELPVFLGHYHIRKSTIIPVPCDQALFDKWIRPLESEKGWRNNDLNSNKRLFSENIDTTGLESMIGESVLMRSVKQKMAFIAKTEFPILLLGESGTGKTFAAELMQRISKRGSRHLYTVDMSTVSENLADSELFGTVRGAYTGAIDRAGIFGEADKSTLFLDEIGNTSLQVQAKLLRVIETGLYRSVGAAKERYSDVRLIFATNENLDELVKQKLFRKDLYNRLTLIALELPPLREHREDIILLTESILRGKNKKISTEAQDALLKYDWPGNIRQLKHCLIRACLFCQSDTIESDDIIFGY